MGVDTIQTPGKHPPPHFLFPHSSDPPHHSLPGPSHFTNMDQTDFPPKYPPSSATKKPYSVMAVEVGPRVPRKRNSLNLLMVVILALTILTFSFCATVTVGSLRRRINILQLENAWLKQEL